MALLNAEYGIDKCQPFLYDIQLTLAANASGSQTLVMTQDAYFELHRWLSTTSAEAVTGDTNPSRFSVSITNQSTGKQLTNLKIPQRILSSLHTEHRQYRPVQFAPGTNLTFEFLNLTAASLTIDLVMEGFKLFV